MRSLSQSSWQTVLLHVRGVFVRGVFEGSKARCVEEPLHRYASLRKRKLFRSTRKQQRSSCRQLFPPLMFLSEPGQGLQCLHAPPTASVPRPCVHHVGRVNRCQEPATPEGLPRTESLWRDGSRNRGMTLGGGLNMMISAKQTHVIYSLAQPLELCRSGTSNYWSWPLFQFLAS